MIFEKTFIDGVFKITPEAFEDNRGVFRRHFCKEEFKNNIDYEIYQSNVSENFNKFTLRGFHYQTGKYVEGKTLSCLKGVFMTLL